MKQSARQGSTTSLAPSPGSPDSAPCNFWNEHTGHTGLMLLFHSPWSLHTNSWEGPGPFNRGGSPRPGNVPQAEPPTLGCTHYQGPHSSFRTPLSSLSHS